MGIARSDFKSHGAASDFRPEQQMNGVFRFGSNGMRHLQVNVSTALAGQIRRREMSAFASKLSAPIAAAILMATVGFAPSASASPLSVAKQIQAPQDAPIVQVHHKKNKKHGNHRGNGWQGGHGGGHYSLGPRQIRRSLRHRGFYRIRIIDRRGPMYIVKAIGWRGMPVRLVVDSRNAHIVRSRPIGHGRHGGHGFYWQHSW